MTAKKVGKVILAGAGPGDAELITIKLQKRLAEAEIIITDRLVNPEIIRLYAPRNVIIHFTGKQGYNEASFKRETINDLIVDSALDGKTVVRLKGGDVAFFSNVLDELLILRKHGIPYEIIPGVTASSGISAYTGIPLTARGYSQGVQFLTFNPGTVYTEEKWKELANTSDTLVFYMAARNICSLAENLLEQCKESSTPLAVIEQGTTIYQKVHTTTLEKCCVDFLNMDFSSPSMVIVGKVVDLYKIFNWFRAGDEDGSIFKDLPGY